MLISRHRSTRIRSQELLIVLSRLSFSMLLLLFLNLGCQDSASVATPVLTRNPVLRLEGKIQIDRKTLSAGETATIRYILINQGEESFETVLADGHSDPKMPFQEFRYNTAKETDPTTHLETLAHPTPISGAVRFDPGQEIEFARVLIRGHRGGTYRLTGEIHWSGRNYVEFVPTILKVLGDADSTDPNVLSKVETLVKSLGSENLRVRQEALDELVAIGEPSVPLLLHHMNHDNEKIRTLTMTTLDRIGPATLPYLRRILYQRNTDPVVLRRSIFLYAKMDADRSARDLLFSLGSERRDVRLVVLESSTRFLSKKARFPLILRCLGDRDEQIRQRAHAALREITPKNFGYNPLDSRQAREVILSRIRTWWEAEQSK
ncbi:MAG: HEAT repeat domain-containing protein [Planctomycetota bacterium]|nr:HEAT repeat domain-containing protein [Planctomycetota bacterium]